MEGYRNLLFPISDLSPGCFHSAIYFFHLHSLYTLHFTFLLGFIFPPTHETACQVRISPFAPPCQEEATVECSPLHAYSLALGLGCGEATLQGWLVLTYLLQLFTQAQASYPALASLWRTRCRAGIIRPGAVGKWQPTLVFLLGKSHGQRSSRLQSLGSQRRRTWLSDSTAAATNAEERRLSRAQTPAVPFLFHPVSLCRLPPPAKASLPQRTYQAALHPTLSPWSQVSSTFSQGMLLLEAGASRCAGSALWAFRGSFALPQYLTPNRLPQRLG